MAEKPVAPRTQPDRHRLLALVVAAAVLFPVLAKSGIWDPYELDAADLARRIAVRVFGAHDLEIPGAASALPTLTDLKMGELPFTSMALGFKLFGLHDWTGRLPLALWGFAGAWVLYEMLARLVDKRAGLYATVALMSMPLYFMQARTMLGDIVTMSALTMAFCGLTGAMLDDAKSKPGWAVIGALGLVAGFMSRGLILGVAVPALSVGFAWVALRGGVEQDEEQGVADLAGAGALIVGLLSLGFGVRAYLLAAPDLPVSRMVGFALLRKPPSDYTFDLMVRQLGHALFPWSAFLPFALGRLLRAPVEAPAASRDRETGVRVALLVGAAVTYGAFALLAPRSGSLPYTAPALLAAVAGVAVLDFERGAPHSRAVAIGTLLFGGVLFADIFREPEKALTAFVVEKPQFPKSFEPQAQAMLVVVLVVFVGLTALTWFESQPGTMGETPKPPAQPAERSPGLAMWARGVLFEYREGFDGLVKVWNGNLLFSLVVIEAALVGLGAMIFIGRRVGWAPVNALPKNFADIGVNAWWLLPPALGSLPALWMTLRDTFREVVRLSRFPRASFTIVAAVIAGGTTSFAYYPALAAQLSPKEAFESYARLAGRGEPLALLSVRSRAAAYYAAGETQSFTDVSRAFTWLTEHPQERRWLLLKADDLPKMNSLFRSMDGHNLPILDGRSSQILLASNQLGGHPNESWLSRMILDEPAQPQHPLDAMFEDQLEALGWEVRDPAGRVQPTVVPAHHYHLLTYYKVVKPITGTWKSFVHIDGYQRRFNGDHNVLDGKYPMNLWRPGDVVVDDLEFQLEPNFTPGGYTVYFGFFQGDSRFKVTRGPNHDNRVIAGTLDVR